MKTALFFAAVLAASLASAQEVQTSPKAQQVVSTRQHIVCISDSQYKFLDEKGVQFAEQTENGKISDSIRTTWATDGVEYRSAASTGYRDNGKSESSKSNSLTKFTTKTVNGLVVESTEVNSITQRLGTVSANGQAVSQTKRTEETSYLVQGNQRIIVNISENGVASNYRGYEVETQISDKVKQVKYITQVPNVDVQDGVTTITVKEELTCTFETLD